MASDDLLSAAGVALILVGGIVYNHLQVARSPRLVVHPETQGTMLGRYASHKGSVVGEVVAITTDRLVLRQAGAHKAVPLAQARLRDGEVVVEGDVDWASAEEAGKSWAGAAPPQKEV